MTVREEKDFQLTNGDVWTLFPPKTIHKGPSAHRNADATRRYGGENEQKRMENN